MSDAAWRNAVDARTIQNIKAAYCRAADGSMARLQEFRRTLKSLLHQALLRHETRS